MVSNSEDSVNSASPTSPKVGRGLFQGAWNAFKAVFNAHADDTPATQILDGIYVEVFDDMETKEVNSKMAGNKEHVEQKLVTNLEKKVYDLNFLLELGKKASKAPHPLRFSSDAIKRTYLSLFHISLKLCLSTGIISQTSVRFTRSRCFILQHRCCHSRSSTSWFAFGSDKSSSIKPLASFLPCHYWYPCRELMEPYRTQRTS